jgi:hypothetical protein
VSEPRRPEIAIRKGHKGRRDKSNDFLTDAEEVATYVSFVIFPYCGNRQRMRTFGVENIETFSPMPPVLFVLGRPAE